MTVMRVFDVLVGPAFLGYAFVLIVRAVRNHFRTTG
jgi:hypothetical protein